MNREDAIETIRAYIAREILDGKDIGLDATTPLLEWGVINSFSLVALVAFMEGTFALRIPPEDIVAKNLENIGAIVALLERIKGR